MIAAAAGLAFPSLTDSAIKTRLAIMAAVFFGCTAQINVLLTGTPVGQCYAIAFDVAACWVLWSAAEWIFAGFTGRRKAPKNHEIL